VKQTGPIKVLIVDDSALVRSTLSRVLSKAKRITVVGGAKDPFEARELIIAFRPDVIILDSELPRMDGLTFLGKLMAHYPVPVIMCCDPKTSHNQLALKAVELGAVDVVAKPALGDRRALHQLATELIEKILAAAVAIKRMPVPAAAAAKPTSFREAGLDPSRYLIAVGASTGGTEAIKAFLSSVPADMPATAIVQHMPEGFTNSFAGRLNQFSELAVTEAVDGDMLVPGKAFVARGGVQMTVRSSGGRWRIAYGTSELTNRHCPSVDVLFDSFARLSGVQTIGILLTGMGDDGAKGLLRMRNAGAITIAQDQRSCVVYGMPKVAVELGAVEHIAAPTQISTLLLQVLRQRRVPVSSTCP
jgi:two-component system, chemotaxis family, protein-glutamate methylesterase/glutaminase